MYGIPPITDNAIEHVFQVKDDSDPTGTRSVWFCIVPSMFGILVNVYKAQPSEEFQIPIATTITELFGNKITARLWNDTDSKGDGEPQVIRLCSNVDVWRQGDEDDAQEESERSNT